MTRIRFTALITTLAAILFATGTAQEILNPGPAHAEHHGDAWSISNIAVSAEWTVSAGSICDLTITDNLNNAQVSLPIPFAILLSNGAIDSPATLHLASQPAFSPLVAQPDASRYAARLPGQQFQATLIDPSGSVTVLWRIVLRNGSNYIRQYFTITAGKTDLPITSVRLIDTHLLNAHVVGTVKGSPIVAGNIFLAFEHPLSDSTVSLNRAVAEIGRQLPLRASQSVTYSSVVGVTRPGQLRREFLRYIERERAHPYRTFLHYNSWYDIGYFTPYNQQNAVNRINAFGEELHVKRGVKISSFLFDDGWDNHNSVWDFNSGFPNGFAPLRNAAAKYGAAPGVWLSPWGGYDGPKKQRIAYGKAHGYEIVNGGFALSGPKYYARFRQVCMEMIQKYGINQFKFDGTGNANTVFPGSRFDSDFDAAIHLIGQLRAVKPDIYINLTTGTYPSPFWLFYADSIWRGGYDDSTAGVGPYRERWITYRDADTYSEIVRRGPLYPLNSLMLHGLIYAQHHKYLDKDPDHDFRNEIRDYFGTGTQLQEMYITPSLLTKQNWDDLAEAANWSRAHADILKDTHWIGGDPYMLEVYGWASWAPRMGILVLRNPNDKPQTIRIDIGKAFQLPEGAPTHYIAHSPWKSDAAEPSIDLAAGAPHAFHLAPFQVLTLDMKPR